MRYDTNKLISWPGFNTELPREFKDEGSRYRVKPQNRCESLKEMKKGMSSKSQKGYRKRKMEDTSVDISRKTVYDMEVEEGECDDELQPPGEKVLVLEKSSDVSFLKLIFKDEITNTCYHRMKTQRRKLRKF